ncbi:hypothetical protein BGLA2_1940012 [Burkholderia gladioli]|nr:hypothetical protein BGLA2_1940012 [Burkholderia gladioli]
MSSMHRRRGISPGARSLVLLTKRFFRRNPPAGSLRLDTRWRSLVYICLTEALYPSMHIQSSGLAMRKYQRGGRCSCSLAV